MEDPSTRISGSEVYHDYIVTSRPGTPDKRLRLVAGDPHGGMHCWLLCATLDGIVSPRRDRGTRVLNEYIHRRVQLVGCI